MGSRQLRLEAGNSHSKQLLTNWWCLLILSIMGAEKFCLRWNDFETNLSSAFRGLRTDQDLFDVTLSCGEESLQAHKLVLSACSDMFRAMFRRPLAVSSGHTILYLRGVHAADMQAVLDFMYHGEVSVAQEELNSFLAVAEDLKVKGLTQKEGQSSSQTQSSKVPEYSERKVTENSYSSYIDPKRAKPEYSAPPPPKKPRPPKPSQATPDPEIEELVPIKTEPVAPQPASYQHQVATMEHIDDAAVDTYDGYGGYEDDGYQYQGQDVGQYAEGQSRGEDRIGLLTYIQKESDSTGKCIYSCSLCGQMNSHRTTLVNHIESSHFPSHHKCDYCDKTFKSKNSKKVHISRNHREVHVHRDSNY